MSKDDIRIERIKIKDLIAFTTQFLETTQTDSLVPITMQRAEAHVHNPYADGEDVSLLVAYQGEVIVGYFGIMPILLVNGTEQDKVYWFTTWLVSPKLRGKSVGSLLLKEALSICQDYLIVGSGSARKVCRRFGFYEFEPFIYYEFDVSGMKRLNPVTWVMRLTRKLFHPLGVKVAIANPVAIKTGQLLGRLTKPLVFQLLKRAYNPLLSEIEVVEVDKVRPETPEQTAHLPRVMLYRGPQVVNWMLEYPWILEPGKSRTEKLPYYFSDVRARYQLIALEISSRRGEGYAGYLVLSVSTNQGQTELKVLDVSLARCEDHQYILPLALKFAHRFQADTVLLPGWAVESLRTRFLGKLILHEKQRTTQCLPRDEGSPLARAWRDITLNYCDGDMAFS